MPTALQASIRSVPAGAVTCLPSTVMVTSVLIFSHVFDNCESARRTLVRLCRLPRLRCNSAVLDFFYLCSVPFGMHRH